MFRTFPQMPPDPPEPPEPPEPLEPPPSSPWIPILFIIIFFLFRFCFCLCLWKFSEFRVQRLRVENECGKENINLAVIIASSRQRITFFKWEKLQFNRDYDEDDDGSAGAKKETRLENWFLGWSWRANRLYDTWYLALYNILTFIY